MSEHNQQKQLLTERGMVLIEVEELRPAESQLHALDQIIGLTEDIAALGF